MHSPEVTTSRKSSRHCGFSTATDQTLVRHFSQSTPDRFAPCPKSWKWSRIAYSPIGSWAQRRHAGGPTPAGQETDLDLGLGADRKGLPITGTSRRGKLFLIETNGPTLGVRFGMTGVLLLDGDAGIEGLFYGPHLFDAKWVRGGLESDDGRKLVVHDPRRMAPFEINPDLDELGPDALSLTRREFNEMIAVSHREGPAIKARLFDQSRVAGVGDLLGDEMIYRAGIDPRTPSGR